MHRSVLAALTLAAALLASRGSAGDTEPVVTDFDDILSSDPSQHGALFGSSCALVGNHLFVGAPFHENPSNSKGAVFQFRRGAHAWIPEGVIPTPSGHGSSPQFALSEALDYDPPRLFVGAPNSSIAGLDRGACLVFEDLDGDEVYELEQTLYPPPPHDGAFGQSIDVEGGRLLVGAPDDGNPPQSSAGTAYVFVRQGGSWILEAQLFPPAGPDPSAYFGSEVAIQGDEAFVWDPALEAVHVYERSGADWGWTQTLVAPVPGNFGYAICTQPGWLAVGGNIQFPESGSVHFFERQGSEWIHQSTLPSPIISPFAHFGRDISRSGDLLAVTDEGSYTFYLFQEHGTTWVQVAAELPPFPPDYAGFPSSVALDASSGLVVVGADTHAFDQGRAVAYRVRNAVSSYCAGDGSAADCPCVNQGAAGAGCANSTGVGGSLEAEGSTSVTLDDLSFEARDLLPAQAALLFAGTQTVAGGAGLAFGDGLRCAGGDVVRLGVSTPDSSGHAFWSSGLAPLGGWQAGEARAFQAWYRDPVGGPCASGFNLTQGLRIEFVP